MRVYNGANNKLNISNMKTLKNANPLRYDAPDMEVVEINVERGFELSGDGFGLGDGTSYDEEDVNW